jgi:hypothetical protein
MVKRIALGLAALALACSGGAPTADPPARAAAPEGRYVRVEVSVAPAVADRLDPEAAARVARAVRQSARDWLEQGDRLASGGELSLVVSVESARLRPGWVTWLFSWAAAPDHLAAQVMVLRGAERLSIAPVRVESALGGWAWRDPDERLDRLARRLGQRLADGL